MMKPAAFLAFTVSAVPSAYAQDVTVTNAGIVVGT
jgi:hypothetical protein